MPETGELFGHLPTPVADSPIHAAHPPAAPPDVAFLVTNHLNMMYMLAAGLIMPPTGFGAKYYRDPLASFPGWIPLFVGGVPDAALRFATEEARYLKPVVAEIRLDDLSGTVRTLSSGGKRDIPFPDGFSAPDTVLLIPAPLPVSRIKSILFPSPDERNAFNGVAADFGNVPVQDFRRGTRKKLFANASGEPWPKMHEEPKDKIPLQVPQAAGGIMALLLHHAHRGELAVEACRQAFDPDNDADDHLGALVGDPILSALSGWMRSGVAPSPTHPPKGPNRENIQYMLHQRLFWEFVAHLLGREHDRSVNGEEILLEFLQVALSALDERLKPGAERLYETLRSLAGLAGATPSELFERHRTPLARAMILFCLRRNCADLLDFDHPALREPDWLAAAILFGARDGWLGMPRELRTLPGLSRGELAAAVSHRMARLAHRMADTDLDLGPCPPRVRPLRELFGQSDSWGTRERFAALELSRACKWDCVSTRVSFAKGEYRLTVSGGSVHIDLPGEPRIAPKIDRDLFFEYLANGRVNPRAEAKVRKLLR